MFAEQARDVGRGWTDKIPHGIRAGQCELVYLGVQAGTSPAGGFSTVCRYNFAGLRSTYCLGMQFAAQTGNCISLFSSIEYFCGLTDLLSPRPIGINRGTSPLSGYKHTVGGS